MLQVSIRIISKFVLRILLGQKSKVGKSYKSKSRSSVSNIGGYWYLNVEVPATCSGSIDQYKIGYYDDNLRSGTYYATLAVWKPTGGGSYEKVNYQLKYVNNLL